jgi:RNA polymerase sigma-70 factor (sigma-E family)
VRVGTEGEREWFVARSRLVNVRSSPKAPGEVEDFDEFYSREYPAIVTLAFALSGSRWAAEDLAQDAFLAAHRDWERIGAYERPGAWVRQVVANLSVSAFRRRMAEAKALTRAALGQPMSVSELSADGADFWRAVRSLPRRQAQAITLHYLEDLAVADIAEILGTAEGTVKKHLHEGRKTLARRLDIEEREA